MKEWIYNNGGIQTATATGSYTVGQDCRLQLTFSSTGNTATGNNSTFQAPTTFLVSLSRIATFGNTGVNTPASGTLIVTPMNLSSVVGTFLPQ